MPLSASPCVHFHYECTLSSSRIVQSQCTHFVMCRAVVPLRPHAPPLALKAPGTKTFRVHPVPASRKAEGMLDEALADCMPVAAARSAAEPASEAVALSATLVRAVGRTRCVKVRAVKRIVSKHNVVAADGSGVHVAQVSKRRLLRVVAVHVHQVAATCFAAVTCSITKRFRHRVSRKALVEAQSAAKALRQRLPSCWNVEKVESWQGAC